MSPVSQNRSDPDNGSRYAHISTQALIDRLDGLGWHLAGSTAAAPRLRSAAYARHRVTFRNKEPRNKIDWVPELHLVNSHDGSCSARLLRGMFRSVSASSIVLSVGPRVRHNADAGATLWDEALRVMDFDDLKEQRHNMLCKLMRPPEQAEFARLAGQLRYGDGWTYPPAALLKPRRSSDGGGNLLSVYHRVQENAVRGGFRGRAASGQGVTALPLSCIQRDASFNAQLWQLAGEFA